MATLLVLLAGAGAAYIYLYGSPTGGEPQARIALDAAGSADPGLSEPIRGSQPTEGLPTLAEPGTSRTRLDEDDTDAADGADAADSDIVIIRPEEGIREQPLSPVPDSRLVERTADGILPRRADDGTAPLSVYARPYDFGPSGTIDNRPRIAILVNGMGLNREQTREAIRALPSDVSFAFAPYASGLQKWVSSARQDGHEVLLQVPLEPFDFPDNDPGPHTLLSTLTPAENLERLNWVMAQMVGYVGITNYMGARFTATRDVVRPMLLELKKRGVLFIDDGTSPRSLAEEIAADINLPARRASVVLDAVPAPDAITAALERLEVAAYRDGVAVGVISALPVSIETVSEWVGTLAGRGIELIPVSASTKARAEG